MRRLPPLGALRAFEAAARHLSFKEAADEIGVTPTAISHQVRLLEEHCGRALFRRRPRPMELTEAGATLYPATRDGLDTIADALTTLQQPAEPATLTVTTTNAFASKWLVPRLPLWRAAHPSLPLEIAGTDAILDLRAGEADVAIRYMARPPTDGISRELFRDRFVAVCRPDLLPGGAPLRRLADLSGQTLIHAQWGPSDPTAPTWPRWLGLAARHLGQSPRLPRADHLSIREELHAIDAACDGQGVLVVSDLLVARELADGTLAIAIDYAMPGHGFYLTYLPDHPRREAFEAFAAWTREVA